MAFVWREMGRENRQADALTIFYTLMSSGQRRAVFDQAQQNERRTLARYIRQEVRTAGQQIDADATPDFDDDLYRRPPQSGAGRAVLSVICA
jgi:hypothetical protein